MKNHCQLFPVIRAIFIFVDLEKGPSKFKMTRNSVVINFHSSSNAEFSKKLLESVEVWHRAGLNLGVFELTVDVDFECAGLHKKCLSHRT